MADVTDRALFPVDPWDEVVGQPSVVALLRSAAAGDPVHAWLFLGPMGSGKRAAARAFAGELLAAEAEALQAVNQSRISRAAAFWLARHPAHAAANLRFDVIFLAPRQWPRHVINAFDAS